MYPWNPEEMQILHPLDSVRMTNNQRRALTRGEEPVPTSSKLGVGNDDRIAEVVGVVRRYGPPWVRRPAAWPLGLRFSTYRISDLLMISSSVGEWTSVVMRTRVRLRGCFLFPVD